MELHDDETRRVAVIGAVAADAAAVQHHHHRLEAVVTSADESTATSSSIDGDNDHSSDDSDDDEKPLHDHPDDLFDDQADEEDEAYVYKHLRSGIEESIKVQIVSNKSTHTEEEVNIQEQGSVPIEKQRSAKKTTSSASIKALKPRHSDAVLSCPCCFNIVCMDCQRHEKYDNQFRAMFVVGITVQWDLRLVYDSSCKRLVPASGSSITPRVSLSVSEQSNSHEDNNNIGPGEIIPLDEQDTLCSKYISEQKNQSSNETIYYTVCCANCQTTVAALDMTDEVYYFHGCIASA